MIRLQCMGQIVNWYSEISITVVGNSHETNGRFRGLFVGWMWPFLSILTPQHAGRSFSWWQNDSIFQSIIPMQYITDIRWGSVENPLTCVSRGQWANGRVWLVDRCLLHASCFTHRRTEMIPWCDCPVSVVWMPVVNVIVEDSYCIST